LQQPTGLEKVQKKSQQNVPENDSKKKMKAPRRAATISGRDHAETPKTEEGGSSPRKAKSGMKDSPRNINKRRTEEPKKKPK